MRKMGISFEEALKAEKINEGNHHPKILDIHPDKKKAIEDINKINSYIECNLYMNFIQETSKYVLQPQEKIAGYRVDFLVKETNIVVECDGYEHHKTKEQITNDCKRQRELTKLGYTIVRFSGTEINRDCKACVSELIEIIEKEVIKNESSRASNY
jgi:very-short-patch-repair endonuclease